MYVYGDDSGYEVPLLYGLHLCWFLLADAAGQKRPLTVKEREKLKRKKGQSSHATWKPETWMQLRQQFD